MSRQRRVADLYASVRSVSYPDALQLLINGESDDFVLADLRDRFWDGTGEKPWQVVEINRLLTRRREARVAKIDAPESANHHKRPDATKLSVGEILGGLRPQALWALVLVAASIVGAAYTLGAKSGGLLPGGNGYKQLVLRIEGVDFPSATLEHSVRVVAEVDGFAYSYFTRAIWADVGPDMSR